MSEVIIEVSREVTEEVTQITGTLPGKVYYSDDGEALILTGEGKYIISVEPPDPPFNGGNPTTHSAYLVTQPAVSLVMMYADSPEDDLNDDMSWLEGWTTGWEC